MKAPDSCRSTIRAISRFANRALEPARAEPVSRAVMAMLEKMLECMMTAFDDFGRVIGRC